MAVTDGEMRDADRPKIGNQIVEDWLDNYLPVCIPDRTMKRKSDEIDGESNGSSLQSKKLKGMIPEAIEQRFRKGLFDQNTLGAYQEEYSLSKPYKHAVIHGLIDDSLLRKVRAEIQENVHFTPKETDIYKIHQSGDLANLDGLDDEALSKLPSLLKLRDALYSPAFRKYVATITNSGELSGRKTDMAINVYTPGCHLLCHDDVIGSRRVSYILYLTDPDRPWQAQWGGALRLYPTSTFDGDDGPTTKTPSPEFCKTIPPAWNQLSFFAVQPGESFHDVEEVYHATSKEMEKKDGGRIRMAISGWYHVPQFGEENYVEGEEARLAENSSLTQLQGKADRYDFPREDVRQVENLTGALAQDGLEPENWDFLLKYMAPTYLTPDTIEQVAAHFGKEFSITLEDILSEKFASRIQKYLEKQEASQSHTGNSEIEKGPWKVARPPHKHRFLYLQHSAPINGSKKQQSDEMNPMQELIDTFLPSQEFRWWLEVATSSKILNHSFLARRFRRGRDYALATNYEGDDARLELCFSLTPTSGWGDESNAQEVKAKEADKAPNNLPKTENGTKNSKVKAKAKAKTKAPTPEASEAEDIGGQEVYMAGDQDAKLDDAAVYKSNPEVEDDNILIAIPPAWNKLTIVLRDSGVLKFVKYLSKSAPGDRWDVVGVFGVDPSEDEDEEEEASANLPALEEESVKRVDDPEEEETEVEEGSEWQPDGATDVGSSFETKSLSVSQVNLDSSGAEDEFHGFPDSGDSDSD